MVRIGNEATPTHGTTTDVVTINCCGRLQAAVGRCTKLHPEQRCARRESSPHYKKTREHVPAVLTNPTASPRHPPRCPSSRTRPRPRETTVPASRTPSSSWISLLPSVFSLLPSAVVRYARPLGTWMWLTPCQACSLWFEIGRTTPSLPPCLSLCLSLSLSRKARGCLPPAIAWPAGLSTFNQERNASCRREENRGGKGGERATGVRTRRAQTCTSVIKPNQIRASPYLRVRGRVKHGTHRLQRTHTRLQASSTIPGDCIYTAAYRYGGPRRWQGRITIGRRKNQVRSRRVEHTRCRVRTSLSRKPHGKHHPAFRVSAFSAGSGYGAS